MTKKQIMGIIKYQMEKKRIEEIIRKGKSEKHGKHRIRRSTGRRYD